MYIITEVGAARVCVWVCLWCIYKCVEVCGGPFINVYMCTKCGRRWWCWSVWVHACNCMNVCIVCLYVY